MGRGQAEGLKVSIEVHAISWLASSVLPLCACRHAATLQQLENGVRVPPSGWKCEKCDLTTNLWLNLTDGSILCGRRYFDGQWITPCMITVAD